MFCTNCGNKIKEEDVFCTECGVGIKKRENTQEDIKIETDSLDRDKKNNEKLIKNKILKKIKLNKREWTIIGIIIITIIVIFFLFYYFKITDVTKNITRSVVNIWCDNEGGGSGTIFSTEGIILTNNHVIEGSTYCLVTIPNPETGKTEEIYEALPVITPVLSKKYDVAILKISDIFVDPDGKSWGTYPLKLSPFVLPKTCDTSKASKLGDPVRIYGYPVTSGGYNLTITDGIISSFTNEGEILTSAQIDSGNSGGLAIDKDGCWLGIPSAVVSGDYQNLGVIIPGSAVKTFINTVPVKLNPIADTIDYTKETISNPEEDNDQFCQSNYGLYSEWTGKLNSKGGPTCTCKTNYSWGATGNTCVLKSALLSECQESYGVGSYSITENGKAVCDCLDGYYWNNGQTSCVPYIAKTNDQICSEKYLNSYYDGTSCSCPSGYYWDNNKDGYSGGCYTISALNQSCNNSYLNSVWDGTYATNGSFVCDCKPGYKWNIALTACY